MTCECVHSVYSVAVCCVYTFLYTYINQWAYTSTYSHVTQGCKNMEQCGLLRLTKLLRFCLHRYMSPEQYMDARLTVGSDLFSLGACALLPSCKHMLIGCCMRIPQRTCVQNHVLISEYISHCLFQPEGISALCCVMLKK
jgi:hypothetical protein